MIASATRSLPDTPRHSKVVQSTLAAIRGKMEGCIKDIWHKRRPTRYERFQNVIGKATGLPTDFAEQHDHYIHGMPIQ